MYQSRAYLLRREGPGVRDQTVSDTKHDDREREKKVREERERE